MNFTSNITSIGDMSLETFQGTIHPPIILAIGVVYLVMVIIFLIVGSLMTSTKNGKEKFFWIWTISSIFSGFVVAVLWFNPSLMKFIIEFFAQNNL